MAQVTEAQINHIIELLAAGQDLPVDYKHLLFPPERQEYELVYAGKEREEDILAETMSVPLQAVRTFGESEPGAWRNMLIFGDNLQVMKRLLSKNENGELVNADGSRGIKLVYIDPPFATRQEFSGAEGERAYQDKIVGARFIEFLRKRLIFLRELLSDTGAIFVHLDWKKGHYIKVIMDEVFGEHRFENEVIWHYPDNLQGNVNRFPNNHHVIYVYSASGRTRFNRVRVPLKSPKKRDVRVWDKETKSLTAGRDDEGNIIYKEYTDKAVDDVWEIGQSSVTKRRSREFIGYPTQKPEEVLRRVIESVTQEGDIVLDAFAGSGTTLAVAEKLKRRWVGIDSGKLAIYTIQRRLLDLREKIGNKGNSLQHEPFTLFNAGLYDFSQLKRLEWEEWRIFGLNLFQCRDEPHSVGGVKLDGYRGVDDVLVFNHLQHGGVVLDHGFIDDLHNQLTGKLRDKFFIIAPAASVEFLEDYVDKGDTRYYILRIPYSLINELHSRSFEALVQPTDETQVNETVEAVGFDFIRLPEVGCKYLVRRKGEKPTEEAVILVETFKSKALVKGSTRRGNRETLSMVMLDFDYDGEVFAVDEVFYAEEIKANGWEIRFPPKRLGKQLMIIYIDIYGNEYKEIKTLADFKNVVNITVSEKTSHA